MPLDKQNVIDIFYTAPGGDPVFLIISDHLTWGDGPTADKHHMFSMQEKVKAYLRFVQSGEVYDKFPESVGKTIVIGVASKHPLSGEAAFFFKKIKDAVAGLGYRIEFHYPDAT